MPTVAVTQGALTEIAEAVGYIKTRDFSMVKSQVDGIVEAIYHEEGEYVKQDTPLIKIKPTPAPIDYAEAYKNLVNDTNEERHAETELKRQEYLFKTGIITVNNYELVKSRKDYEQARNQKTLSEQKLALITRGETVVGDKAIANIINSPIDGYILYRNVNLGDPVISIKSSQSATSLFVVANMKELVFQGSVDERDAAKIKPGMVAKIKVGSLPDKEITGKISRIALQSDKENANLGMSGSVSNSSSSSSSNSPFNVGFKIEVANLEFPRDLVLRSGYSAIASVEVKKLDNVLMLPIRAIQFKDAKPYVLLPGKHSKKPQEQPVDVGISDGINVEITRGLKLGEKVLDQSDVTVVMQNK